VFSKYQQRAGFPPGTAPPTAPPLRARLAYPPVLMAEAARMLSPASLRALEPARGRPWPRVSDVPPSMEALGFGFGFVLYETTTEPWPHTANATATATVAADATATLGFRPYPRDRCHAFVDGRPALRAPLYRPTAPKAAALNASAAGGQTLSLLVEHMGRLNYGAGMFDHKGVDGAGGEAVLLNGLPVAGRDAWRARALPLEYEQLQKLPFAPVPSPGRRDADAPFTPTFFRGSLLIDPAGPAPADTYLVTRGWGKGSVWVNGFNLGRFWEAEGPQHALYLPAPLLRPGANELIVLELDAPPPAANRTLGFATAADFRKPQPTCGAPVGAAGGAGPAAGDQMRMFDCGGANAQRQAWVLNSWGGVQFVPPANSAAPAAAATGHGLGAAAPVALCLNVGPDQDPALQSPFAQLEPCSNVSAQQQMLPPSPAGAQGPIRNGAQGLCLDVSNHDKGDGAPAGFYRCTAGGAPNQRWAVQDTPAHTVQIVVNETGKCLTAC
jgi:hypothetical protein